MSDLEQKRHPGPGSFYIEPDCCLLCGVPESIAPELFHTGEVSCSFIRQPVGPAEIDKTIVAMDSNEVDCIRYAGSDPEIIRRLGEGGLGRLADDPAAMAFRPIERDLVVFQVPQFPRDKPLERIAAMFRAYLSEQEWFTVRPIGFLRKRRVRFSWNGPNFHAVTFKNSRRPDSFMAVLAASPPYALKGLGRVVHGWLEDELRAEDISWYSRTGFLREEAASPKPL